VEMWSKMLTAGETEEVVLGTFLSGSEYYSRAQTLAAGATPDEKFVQSLYNIFLNRTGSAEDVSGWVTKIGTIGRGGVVTGILKSPEYRGDQIEAYYNSLLRRPGDAGGRASWVGRSLDLCSIRIEFESTPEFYVNG